MNTKEKAKWDFWAKIYDQKMKTEHGISQIQEIIQQNKEAAESVLIKKGDLLDGELREVHPS